MAEASLILTDSSGLSRMDVIYYRLESWLTLAGGMVIFLLILLASTNVLGRWFFNIPIDGYIDMIEQAMAFFAFLGIAYTQRQGGHIRMDALIGRFSGRTLWVLELISVICMLVITLFLIYGSFLHFLRAFEYGDSSADIDLPTWPAKLVVPVALSVLALRFILQIWGYSRAFKLNTPSPVAVPLIESAKARAQAEAESVLGDEIKS